MIMGKDTLVTRNSSPHTILLVNSFLSLRGGDTTYLYAINELLRRNGKTTALFGMRDSKSTVADDERILLEPIDFPSLLAKFSFKGILTATSRSIYSIDSQIAIERFIKKYQPEIAHLNNIHNHISPSILSSLRRYGIPIVWTLHDYTILCPNSTFVRNGQICELCKGGRFYSCLRGRCKKGSIGASGLAALSAYVHGIMNSIELADHFIAPSRFLREKFIEFGFNPSKITHLPNPMDLTTYQVELHDDGYILYAGRLSEEKGVVNLVRAMKRLPNIMLKIAGQGPLEVTIRQKIDEAGMKNIQLIGHLLGDKLKEVIRRARLVVLPSEWYENFPYAILEAFAFGKPVVASAIGGIPELVEDGLTGFLFEPGNEGQLAEKIDRLFNQTNLRNTMCENARRKVESACDPVNYYVNLNRIYQMCLSHRRHCKHV